MTRAENLLFALYAFRISILERDQFLAICLSLRHGKDVDLGQSLMKRGIIEELQYEALWSMVSAQVQIIGSAKKALSAVDPGVQLQAAINAAIKPQMAPRPRGPQGADPPTINLEVQE